MWTDYESAIWLCGPGKIIERGELGLGIALDLDRAEAYELGGWPPGLLYKAAAVRGPMDALGIVRHHGLLRLGPPLPSTHAEPFHWWTNLANELNWILRGYQLVQAASRGTSGAFAELRAFARDDASICQDSRRRHEDNPDPPDGDLIYSVSRMVGLRISKGLAEAGGRAFVEPTPEDPAHLHLYPGAETLEALIWHELADEVTKDRPVRQCAECNSMFRVRDRRQRYCSDRCAVRVRARRFRQKKKESAT